MNIPMILNTHIANNYFTFTMLFLFLLASPSVSTYAQVIPHTGTVKIITEVINDEGGTKQPSDFSNCVDTSGANSNRVHCSSGNEQGNFVTSIPAPFKVSEDPSTPQTGYSVSYSEGCSGSISAGSTNTCTITYNDTYSPTIPNFNTGNGPATIFSLPQIFE